ncbi:hypothetical protein [Chitinophaga sp.]|uniref:hypothetical protein n=1 Tax=Chitinophaga sp. TaxID=1869181 RepID=UPI0031E181E2
MKTVYVDTSVLGGCFDPEFAGASLALFDKFKRGQQKMMFSDALKAELIGAPERVRKQLIIVPLRYRIMVKISVKASALSRVYIKEGALSNHDEMDAMHIALATLNCADILASWNFKHMANKDKEKLYNSINKFMGYRSLEIRSPREL